MLSSLLYRAEICLLLLCRSFQLEGAATGLKEAVKSDSIIAAALGGEANFYCNFSLSMDVLQVTWQKRNGSSFQNIATYSFNHGPRLIEPFQKKVRFTTATLKASAITLQNLTFEDESYYQCIFNVFPHGSFSKDIYLNIQTISELKVGYDSHLSSKGLLTAVCSATGKPAPKITWLDNSGPDEPSEIHHIQNANGTVTVANRCTFSANHLRALTCLLDHPQGRKMKALYLEKEREGDQKSIIIMAVLTVVVFLTIFIHYVIRLINRKRKRQERHSAPRTPAEEKGLHQDRSEEAMSLHTLKDQHIVYQNEKRTPNSSLHERLSGEKRNLREKKKYKRLFPEKIENLKSNTERQCKVWIRELGCTPIKEDREATAGGESK
ncbi:OX-2 membrane glycoprotein-like [Grus americana]|nr:OX-2 membrane glycoprotein-like [Grus americana]